MTQKQYVIAMPVGIVLRSCGGLVGPRRTVVWLEVGQWELVLQSRLCERGCDLITPDIDIDRGGQSLSGHGFVQYIIVLT